MIIEENTYLKLFANCIFVDGAKRSTLCDLQKGKYEFIPNSMVDVISELKQHPIKTVLKNNSKENRQTILEYIDYLISKEYAFYCEKDELDLFPEIINQWDYPGEISNAIIDIDIKSNHDFQKIFTELEELGCQYVLIKSYSPQEIDFFEKVLELIKDSTISSIEIVTPLISKLDKNKLNMFLESNKRIRSITFSGSDSNKQEVIKNCLIEYVVKEIKDNSCCGAITPRNFRINVDAFFESKNYNSCLNRKIAIDIHGDIKNCPSMAVSYGNTKNTTLKEVLYKKEFKENWKVKKDQIEICKDCEFRHICSDCRAFLNKTEQYNKPKKCNYDPYTATWN